MRSFEYVRTSIAESGTEEAKAEAAARIRKDWLELLNSRGEHGWELVTERFEEHKDAKLFSAFYTGTMKRMRD